MANMAHQVLHQQGQKLYQKGDFKAAIEAFNEVARFSLALAFSIILINELCRR